MPFKALKAIKDIVNEGIALYKLDDQVFISMHDLYVELSESNVDAALKAKAEDALIEFAAFKAMDSYVLELKGDEMDKYRNNVASPQNDKAIRMMVDVMKLASTNAKVSADTRADCKEKAEAYEQGNARSEQRVNELADKYNK